MIFAQSYASVTFSSMLKAVASSLLIFLSLIAPVRSQDVNFSTFKRDAYILEYPSSWQHTEQQTPDGNIMQMFTGPQTNGSMPYCHITQQALSPFLNPRSIKMSKADIRDFFLKSSDFETFRGIYSALVTAPEFRLLTIGPNVLGKTVPGMAAEFTFRIPKGFYYRVRSLYTFWPKAQISVWCQVTSMSLEKAESGYHVNLASFQRFFANVQLTN